MMKSPHIQAYLLACLLLSPVGVVCFAQTNTKWLPTAQTQQQQHQQQRSQSKYNGARTSLSLSLASQSILDRLSRQNRPSSSSYCQHEHERQRQPKSTTCLQVASDPTLSANGANGVPKIVQNRFHDYNKPIVLMGCSSSSQNELLQLAKSLQQHEAFASFRDQRILVPESFHNNNKDDAEMDDDVTVVEDTRLLASVLHQGSDYAWPDIIVLDTKYKTNPNDMDMLRSLYQDAGVLSIFVNVEPNVPELQRTAETQTQKEQHEQDFFVPFSDYELCVRNQGLYSDSNLVIDTNDATDFDWDHVEWELTRLLARARLISALPGDTTRSENTAHLTMGQHTFFLSLSFPTVTEVQPHMSELCMDVDAMEYRTDLLQPQIKSSRFELLYGMQQVRSYCRPNAIRAPGLPLARTVLEDVLPLVYTVRTEHQAGTFPDDEEGIQKMFEMLAWGLRGGVEVLDVESAWNFGLTSDLLSLAEDRYSTQILGSHHVVEERVTMEDAVLLFEQCALNGRAHGAKVVLSIEKEDDDRLAYEAGLIASELAREEGQPVIPQIALVLGDVGQFSRIINLPFTPVTHEALPSKAAPGQLTAMEIMTTRLLTKIFESKRYAILGHNIAYSVSPQMHGAAFRATKLPHEYVRADVETVQEFVESDFFLSGDFGGCSVTIPHKQAIIPYMDVLSDAAERIGSVNTVIAKEEYLDDEGFQRVLYGDNTDWKGLYNPLNRLLEGSVDSENDYALILGAGGTARAAAYVAGKLGLKILYFNRTPSKAMELSESFGGNVVSSLEKDGEGEEATPGLGGFLKSNPSCRIRVVISTLPASSNFVLPDWMVNDDSHQRPIVFDVNYKPYQTNLLEQAVKHNCPVVRGSEMLWEQGVGQFELWTGRTAPYAVMKQIVLENCLETVLE